jgi:hypothetical protein
MSLKVTFFSFTLLLLFNPSLAQDIIGNRDRVLVELSKRRTSTPVVDYDGSPFLNENFVKGEIHISKNKFIDVPLRYNIFSDNIEFKQNDIVYALLAEPKIKKVQFDGNTFLVEPIGKGKFEFLVLLDSGKVVLMSKKRVVLFQEKKRPSAFETKPPKAKFIRERDVYFYKIGQSGTTKVSSLKSLIENLPDKQGDVNQFAKKEKISAKKEEDLVTLIKYYNSL